MNPQVQNSGNSVQVKEECCSISCQIFYYIIYIFMYFFQYTVSNRSCGKSLLFQIGTTQIVKTDSTKIPHNKTQLTHFSHICCISSGKGSKKDDGATLITPSFIPIITGRNEQILMTKFPLPVSFEREENSLFSHHGSREYKASFHFQVS